MMLDESGYADEFTFVLCPNAGTAKSAAARAATARNRFIFVFSSRLKVFRPVDGAA